MDKKSQLEIIEKEAKECKKCKLHKTRTNVVFGNGNPESKILFIGEGPGFNEDKKGIPFCGKAGEVLDLLLASIGFEREDIYITNVVKCRPPNNRDPEEEEIESCSNFLTRQLEIIKPKVIVCLGRYSMKEIFKRFSINETSPISKLHGNIFQKDDFFIVPLYHPAVAVYNPDRYNVLKNDFEKIKEVLEKDNTKGKEDGYLF